jgi:branched-chain amino acid transport system permease protein
MPSLSNLYPYFVLGLAFGAVYAVAGTGLVVLYRTTGVLNFAFGAIGMVGTNISWSLLQTTWCPEPIAYAACVVFSVLATMLYGLVIAPQFAQRDPLTKSVGTLGFALLLVGIVFIRWRTADARKFELPMKQWRFDIGDARLNGVHLTGLVFALVVTAGVSFFLKSTRLGTAMRAIANDREIAALAGVPVRKVESIAWLGAGLICGMVGLLLASLVNFDVNTLAFSLMIPCLAAAVIGRLRSLWMAFFGGLLIGVVEKLTVPLKGNLQFVKDHGTMAPFVIAILFTLWFGRKRTIVLSGREMR